MFQSHAGSIEAAVQRGDPYDHLQGFQSHAGSIEAHEQRHPGRPLRAFQSHAGSIEAAASRMPGLVTPFPFQSHAGSIEAPHPGQARLWASWVSIPRWFD